MGSRGGRSHAGGGAAGGKFASARDFLQRAYGGTHTRAILNMLQNAPTYIQQMWEDYGSSFRAARTNPNSTDAYYSPRDNQVYLGINDVARGGTIYTPYSTLFHEYGHMTDFLIAREQGHGIYSAYSETYRSGLLGRTAKNELEGHLNRIMRSDPTLTRMDAAYRLKAEAESKYSKLDRSDISDMMEGAGIGISQPLGSGHRLSYWSNRDNGKEIFAEITSAEAAAPGSLKAIKEYFPKTYDVYREMLKERKKR